MTSLTHSSLGKTLLGLALASAFGAASAQQPAFTFNPAAVGLSGSSFSADNILISDFATVRNTGGGTFSETGYLAISGFQLGGTTQAPTGLNSSYGLYIAFTGTGTQSPGNPVLVPTFGTFTTLNFTLYGYNGSASFGFDGFNNPTESASGEVALATGSLINGSVVSLPTGTGSFTPSANAQLSFNVLPSASGFFSAPSSFYQQAFAAFTNSPNQVTPIQGGFRIAQGGGAINFIATQVPEPETYAMMLGGLMAIGFVARRRKAG
ncbi:flocculation-associated PEP-CTERM protein PepA [Paucibacter sp. APW11]|uniref:Flocculation-associated PEP-CTERM protein PepA n=1 Tax=Roseateles aquae TaxID=3077235 RepID=A0ABU3PEZ1_9BURK|nr:flocculation-associated PEP-CTERM protein PepA [Paucibacter sp. APW11]MDT9001172.1 flocculation-associated PEP-CTERM protein PepA [Paucibacter sp. APW11]